MPTLPRVLTAAGAARLGWTEARIRTELQHGRWRRLAPGVYLTRPDVPTRADWAVAGMALAGPGAALTGWDAVRVRGLGTPRPPSPLVVVLAPAGLRNRVVGELRIRPTRRAVTFTRMSLLDDQLPGVRVVEPARAIADAALEYRNLAAVRDMVTSAVQRGLATAEDLIRELDASPRNGSALLRRAVADLADDVHSVAEAEAVEQLRAVNVRDFLANAPILDPSGRLLFRVDLLWPLLRAVIEIDSREFHFGEVDWKATMARHNALTDMGYVVKHYPPSVIRSQGRAWALEVRRWLDGRAALLGLAS